MSKLRVVELLSILAAVVGAIALSVVASLTKVSIAAGLSLVSAVIGLLGLYLVAHNSLVERRLQVMEDKDPAQAISEMLTQVEWYEQLDLCLRAANTSIDITHHEPRLPTLSGIPAKVRVFETLGKRIRQKQVLVRWIIAVNTPEKLTWVESLVAKYAKYPNLDIRHSPVPLDTPSPPISVQITDGSKAFVIDMAKSHHTLSELDTDLFTRDPAVVRQYRRYYETYWSRCVKIKEGGIIYSEALRELGEELRASAIA